MNLFPALISRLTMIFVEGPLPYRRDEGQTLVEYALIISLIALAVTGAAIFLGGQITSEFSKIGSDL